MIKMKMSKPGEVDSLLTAADTKISRKLRANSVALHSNSPDERADMLQQIGVASTEKLFESIPETLRLREHLNVPAAMSELELLKRFEDIARATRRHSASVSWVAAHIRITRRRSWTT